MSVKQEIFSDGEGEQVTIAPILPLMALPTPPPPPPPTPPLPPLVPPPPVLPPATTRAMVAHRPRVSRVVRHRAIDQRRRIREKGVEEGLFKMLSIGDTDDEGYKLTRGMKMEVVFDRVAALLDAQG